MNDRWGVVPLAVAVALALLVPTGIGAALDRWLDSTPVAMAVGAAGGALIASAGVTRVIVRRYARLAPPGPEEEDKR
mgnify:CR=1 FL=1